MPEPDPSPQADQLAARGRKLQAAASARPSLADIRAELPEGAVQVVEHEDGTCDGKVVGPANVRRFMQMQMDSKRLEVEVGAEMNDEIETTKIEHPRFGTIDCPVVCERQMYERHGAKSRRRHGRVVMRSGDEPAYDPHGKLWSRAERGLLP